MPVVIPPLTSRFRDMSDAISPTWWNGPVGQRFRYSQSVMWDALGDASSYAVRSRFPSLAPPDAFPVLESDRRIIQGFAEPNSSYAIRLRQWLDTWRAAGSPTGVLLSVLGLFLPTNLTVRTVDNSSNWNTYAAGGGYPFPITSDSPTPPTQVPTAGSNWDWDGNFTKWWRAWVIIYVGPLGWSVPGHTWGDGGNWGDVGRLWGIRGPTIAQLALIRAVVAEWKPAHCRIENIILTANTARFDPAHVAGGGVNPDGTWGNPANRFPDCAFLSGIP